MQEDVGIGTLVTTVSATDADVTGNISTPSIRYDVTNAFGASSVKYDVTNSFSAPSVRYDVTNSFGAPSVRYDVPTHSVQTHIAPLYPCITSPPDIASKFTAGCSQKPTNLSSYLITGGSLSNCQSNTPGAHPVLRTSVKRLLYFINHKLQYMHPLYSCYFLQL